MTGPKPTQTQKNNNKVPPPPPSSTSKISGEMGSGSGGHKFPNPAESVNPDAATLREQWRFAIRQYSKWYSHAWGTAILAGVSFFALGWVIKGSNPLPSLQSDDHNKKNNPDTNTNPSAAADLHQGR